MFPQAEMNAFIQFTLMCSLLNSPCNAVEEKKPRGKNTRSQKQCCYMKETGISNNLQKLAVNVESCLFIHSVIPTEVKRKANELQTENRYDYFICIQAVVNKPPTRFWFLFTAGFILFCCLPFTHKHTGMHRERKDT